jgi:hypothetical protein
LDFQLDIFPVSLSLQNIMHFVSHGSFFSCYSQLGH